MVVVMNAAATPAQLDDLLARIRRLGLEGHVSHGSERTIVGVLGDGAALETEPLDRLPGVERVVRVSDSYRLASRDLHTANRIVALPNGVRLGGREVVVMAGPCSVESRGQLEEAADAVAACGLKVLRGGAFKPRTSPYSFQGLGEKALVLLREVADARGMAVITEVLTPEDVPLVAEYAEILQIGARNMQNYSLLRACSETDRPVLLKRGLGCTLDEMMQAAEYVLTGGNEQVILCERGIRTFERSTRFTLDINAVPVLKHLTSLPVVVDPSHATGLARYVGPIARAGIAAGADGLLVEVHPNPSEALSDGAQSLDPPSFRQLVDELRRVAAAVGRRGP